MAAVVVTEVAGARQTGGCTVFAVWGRDRDWARVWPPTPASRRLELSRPVTALAGSAAASSQGQACNKPGQDPDIRIGHKFTPRLRPEDASSRKFTESRLVSGVRGVCLENVPYWGSQYRSGRGNIATTTHYPPRRTVPQNTDTPLPPTPRQPPPPGCHQDVAGGEGGLDTADGSLVQ